MAKKNNTKLPEINHTEPEIPSISQVFEWDSITLNRLNLFNNIQLKERQEEGWEVFQFITPFGASDQIMIIMRRVHTVST